MFIASTAIIFLAPWERYVTSPRNMALLQSALGGRSAAINISSLRDE
jgi:hypothetical protein